MSFLWRYFEVGQPRSHYLLRESKVNFSGVKWGQVSERVRNLFPSPHVSQVLFLLLSSDQRGHREWTGRAWDKSKRMLRPGWVVVIFHPLKNSNENAKTQTAVMVYLTCPPRLPHACRTTTKQFYTQQRQNPPFVFSLRSFFYSFPFLFFILFSFTLNHCSLPRKLSLHSRPWAPAAESDASEHGWRSIQSDWWGSSLRPSCWAERGVDRQRATGTRQRESQPDTKQHRAGEAGLEDSRQPGQKLTRYSKPRGNPRGTAWASSSGPTPELTAVAPSQTWVTGDSADF